jgi:hypothetical protein
MAERCSVGDAGGEEADAARFVVECSAVGARLADAAALSLSHEGRVSTSTLFFRALVDREICKHSKGVSAIETAYNRSMILRQQL